MLPLRVMVILIAKVSIFIANMLFGKLPWVYCARRGAFLPARR